VDIVIIEDEELTANDLASTIKKVDKNIQIENLGDTTLLLTNFSFLKTSNFSIKSDLPINIPPNQNYDIIVADIVGPVCESGDFLARQRMLPPVKRGGLLAIYSTGAYAMVMASQYNSRPRAAEVLVNGGLTRLIRRRETYEDLVAAEELESA